MLYIYSTYGKHIKPNVYTSYRLLIRHPPPSLSRAADVIVPYSVMTATVVRIPW